MPDYSDVRPEVPPSRPSPRRDSPAIEVDTHSPAGTSDVNVAYDIVQLLDDAASQDPDEDSLYDNGRDTLARLKARIAAAENSIKAIQRGADVDLATLFHRRTDLHAVSWRERLNPFAG